MGFPGAGEIVTRLSQKCCCYRLRLPNHRQLHLRTPVLHHADVNWTFKNISQPSLVKLDLAESPLCPVDFRLGERN
ncbi:unnamed protein product [Linum trigynum]|uniref:Uncharacterized protein n=1 Tax=Linum trigynum TaxID=586398 RepID=A0AAV2CCQ4_9ROSI